MFLVSDTDAAAIRAALQEGGELSAAVELRRRFRGIDSNAQARRLARIIAGWTGPERPGATDATAREISEGAGPGEGGSAVSVRL
ncbi:hypothetical protein [Roseomonas sp. KE0001]|uniref:hypothetical protein n=1 Tax=Roseomonas sp. KE0001 TaxID=2479201 RepID=UPI0018E03D72|nr:hypothetical protein [Roseomonas sp. KE0001]MBI0436173.1 hypothetical protein [Roseomonas sp. KE0001]